MWECGWGSGWHGWGMGLMGIIWWVLVVVAAVVVLRWLVPGLRAAAPRPTAGESALDLLKQRYARGEINGDEFARIKREIE